MDTMCGGMNAQQHQQYFSQTIDFAADKKGGTMMKSQSGKPHGYNIFVNDNTNEYRGNDKYLPMPTSDYNNNKFESNSIPNSVQKPPLSRQMKRQTPSATK